MKYFLQKICERQNLLISLQSDFEESNLPQHIKHREVSEWLKEHAWKVCILQKGIEGSNPFLSAKPTCKIMA